MEDDKKTLFKDIKNLIRQKTLYVLVKHKHTQTVKCGREVA